MMYLDRKILPFLATFAIGCATIQPSLEPATSQKEVSSQAQDSDDGWTGSETAGLPQSFSNRDEQGKSARPWTGQECAGLQKDFADGAATHVQSEWTGQECVGVRVADETQ